MYIAEVNHPKLSIEASLSKSSFFSSLAPKSSRTRSGEIDCAGASRDAQQLGFRSAPSIQVHTSGKTQITLTHLCSEHGVFKASERIPTEDAYLVLIHLIETGFHQWWQKDEPRPVSHFFPGGVEIIDLSLGPVSLRSGPFECLQLHIPYVALTELSPKCHGNRVCGLSCPQGKIDATSHRLALSVLDEIRSQEKASPLYLHHLTYAFLARIASLYDCSQPERNRARGGLAPWQVRRAKALLLERLEGGGCLTEIARGCDLSASHFARAFKQTIGVAPFRWLGEQRIQVARNLLLHSEIPMTEIAMKCGFADQACFTRAFKRAVGSAPGEWRRANVDRSRFAGVPRSQDRMSIPA